MTGLTGTTGSLTGSAAGARTCRPAGLPVGRQARLPAPPASASVLLMGLTPVRWLQARPCVSRATQPGACSRRETPLPSGLS